jgi:hypothetical protein
MVTAQCRRVSVSIACLTHIGVACLEFQLLRVAWHAERCASSCTHCHVVQGFLRELQAPVVAAFLVMGVAAVLGGAISGWFIQASNLGTQV